VSGWQSAQIDEIPKRHNGWIPVRDHFGITAFGVNAWTKRETDGEVIPAHNEEFLGHEELYYVFRGHAKFTIGDDEVDAPEGTIVFVRDPGLTRGATPVDDDTVILTAGAKPGEAFRVSDWEQGSEYNARAFPLYNEKRYEEAAEVLREGVEAHPRNAGLLYNLACFESLAGEKEQALEHLRRAFELHPGFFEFAKTDSDLDPIRNEPGYPT
jgi:tetratricopeptide (TPR) repeat protein